MVTRTDGRTLPWSWYTDEAVLRLEQERVFQRAWQYAGRADQVAEPGSFFAYGAGEIPVVVVRDREGSLNAFLNVCRHRGSLIVEGEGRRESLQCPYHAWTYGLDGSLRAAPRSDREPGFDRSELGLCRVAVGTWGPFVFVNPDPAAAPLEEWLGKLPTLLAEGGIDVDALVFHHRSEGSYEANWKLCCENYLECYHCQVAHPGFSKVIDVSPDAYQLEESRTFSSQFAPVRENAAGAYDPTGEVARGQFHFLFPNVTINVMAGRPNLSIGPVLPDGAQRSTRFLDYFFGPGVDDAWIADMLAFDDQVGVEDLALVERVQKGMRASALLEHGRLLGSSEHLIAHFQGYLLDELSG